MSLSELKIQYRGVLGTESSMRNMHWDSRLTDLDNDGQNAHQRSTGPTIKPLNLQ